MRFHRALNVDPGMAGVLTASSSPRARPSASQSCSRISATTHNDRVSASTKTMSERPHAIGLGHVFFFNRAGERSADFDA